MQDRSADRVEAPCTYAGPDGCGGCDFQHVTLPAQRALKAQVVAEQLRRLAGLDVGVEVEEVAGDENGLRWRTRVQYAVDRDGRTGFRKHRSHEVVPVDDCLITRRDARVVEQNTAVDPEPVVEPVETRAGGHDFEVAGDGFWQVHPGAPAVLVETVLAMLAPRPGERCLDLYGGVGLFSAFLAEAVGPAGGRGRWRWTGSPPSTPRTIWPGCRGPRCAVARSTGTWPGARRTRGPRRPRPAARGGQARGGRAGRGPLAPGGGLCRVRPGGPGEGRGALRRAGYGLTALRAFDLFPMTHHVECVALLETSPDLKPWSSSPLEGNGRDQRGGAQVRDW